MKIPPKRKVSEKSGAERLISLMRARGWWVRRLNVSAGIYSTPGFPDYYALHKKYGQRWIEFKAPYNTLSSVQIDMFNQMAEYGGPSCSVWVLHDERDYDLLFKPANWFAVVFIKGIR